MRELKLALDEDALAKAEEVAAAQNTTVEALICDFIESLESGSVAEDSDCNIGSDAEVNGPTANRNRRRSEPRRPVSVLSVVALNDLHLQLDFDDGLSRTVDVTPYVQGPNYKQIRMSEAFFRTAHVESGAVVWDNGAMLDAELLRYKSRVPSGSKAKAAKKSGSGKKTGKRSVVTNAIPPGKFDIEIES